MNQNYVKNTNIQSKLVKNIVFTDFDKNIKNSFINTTFKEKKNKSHLRINYNENNSETKKNKIKLGKKHRSQINLNNEYDFFSNENFMVKNLHNESNHDISSVKKNKKKHKNTKLLSTIKSNNDLSDNIINKHANNDELIKKVVLSTPLTIQQLSNKLDIPEAKIITWLFLKSISVTINQIVDVSIATQVAEYYGFTVIKSLEFKLKHNHMINKRNSKEIEIDSRRAPIIAIFGHVDHGKTTLLDCILKTNLAKSELGGITQSITGHEVEINYNSSKEKLVFLDTPGHEAFEGMRSRGAKVTDLAILVVAADDGLQPQTIEAINYILHLQIPYVVAINKVDKPDINIKYIKQQLHEYNIGNIQPEKNDEIIEVSALKNLNIKTLLHTLCNLSKKNNLQANINSLAEGTILEANLNKRIGIVAHLVVQDGTLKIGDIVVAGHIYGRVKSIRNHYNAKVNKAGPSSIITMLGFSSIPEAGLRFKVVLNEKDAKHITNKYSDNNTFSSSQNILNTRITLDSYNTNSKPKLVNVVLKIDTQGSKEAIINALTQIPQGKVQINILAANFGEVSNKDIKLAITSKSIILGFNTSIHSGLINLVNNSGVKIKLFNIIYDLLDYIKEYMLSLVNLEYSKKLIGRAIVQTVFSVNKGTVAGCLVTSGKLKNKANINVYRNEKLLHDATIHSLKQIKENIEEVSEGNECGLMCDNYHLWNTSDIIEAYELIEKTKVL
uniref:Translation initiation factor IF-2, chloroplastic n=1 Tax=Dicranema revolutum TaxID=239144 RepID=A0A4D6WR08_9FLOR|nr:Translation initiation factor 2 [Dicranema revolutum]